jgi:molecular chaperone HscC
MAYGLHARNRELRGVVLDLGGGTFDVTVLEIIEGVIEVQASAGDARLGGEDFVDVIAELVRDHVQAVAGLELGVDRRALALVRELCESAKHRLSTAPAARIVHPELRVGATTVALDVEIDRQAAEQRWSPLLERMQRVIVRALRDAGLDPSAVDEVLLVGGATRMPCVQRLAAHMFGRLPLRTLPPDEAVAMGAAVQSGLVARDAALGDLVVTDVTPFTLGIDVTSQFAGHGVRGIYSPIIDRGTVIPCSRIERYTTTSDRQREISFCVYQGEHPDCRKNLKLGELTVSDLPARPSGEVQIDVRFTYDLNGLLEVDAIEVATGRTVNALFRGAGSKRTPEQITAARAAMRQLKFHPREALPNTTALARAEALYTALTGPIRGELGGAIAAFRAVLQAQDPGPIREIREQLIMLTDRLSRSRGE